MISAEAKTFKKEEAFRIAQQLFSILASFRVSNMLPANTPAVLLFTPSAIPPLNPERTKAPFTPRTLLYWQPRPHVMQHLSAGVRTLAPSPGLRSTVQRQFEHGEG